MASSNKTSNFNLTQFVATDKPAWLTDYNSDMQAIDTAIAASGVQPATAGKTGTSHTVRFTGGGDMCKFVATTDFNKGDKLVLNGAEIALRDSDGAAFNAEAWKTGDMVVLALTPSAVKVVAPLRNKVGKVKPQELALPLESGVQANTGTRAVYTIDDTGWVVVKATLRRNDGSAFQAWNPVAILPVGARPAENTPYFPVVTDSLTGGTRGVSAMMVNTAGGVTFVNVTGAASPLVLHLNLGFYAAN